METHQNLTEQLLPQYLHKKQKIKYLSLIQSPVNHFYTNEQILEQILSENNIQLFDVIRNLNYHMELNLQAIQFFIQPLYEINICGFLARALQNNKRNQLVIFELFKLLSFLSLGTPNQAKILIENIIVVFKMVCHKNQSVLIIKQCLKIVINLTHSGMENKKTLLENDIFQLVISKCQGLITINSNFDLVQPLIQFLKVFLIIDTPKYHYFLNALNLVQELFQLNLPNCFTLELMKILYQTVQYENDIGITQLNFTTIQKLIYLTSNNEYFQQSLKILTILVNQKFQLSDQICRENVVQQLNNQIILEENGLDQNFYILQFFNQISLGSELCRNKIIQNELVLHNLQYFCELIDADVAYLSLIDQIITNIFTLSKTEQIKQLLINQQITQLIELLINSKHKQTKAFTEVFNYLKMTKTEQLPQLDSDYEKILNGDRSLANCFKVYAAKMNRKDQ